MHLTEQERVIANCKIHRKPGASSFLIYNRVLVASNWDMQTIYALSCLVCKSRDCTRCRLVSRRTSRKIKIDVNTTVSQLLLNKTTNKQTLTTINLPQLQFEHYITICKEIKQKAVITTMLYPFVGISNEQE